MAVLSVILRTVFTYVFVLFMLRLMGKREIGHLSPFDFVVAIIIAELAAMPLEQPDTPLWHGLLPLSILVVLEIGFAYASLHWTWLRRVLNGVPQMIVREGRFNIKEMRCARYNLDEILGQLREEGYPDLRRVAYAVLENSGELSVIPGGEGTTRFPYILIADGIINYDNLTQAGITAKTLEGILRSRGLTTGKVFLAMVNTDGTLWLQEKDESS